MKKILSLLLISSVCGCFAIADVSTEAKIGDSIIFYRKVFAKLNKTHADLLKASQIVKIVSLDANGNAMVELSQLSVATAPTNSIQNTENNSKSLVPMNLNEYNYEALLSPSDMIFENIQQNDIIVCHAKIFQQIESTYSAKVVLGFSSQLAVIAYDQNSELIELINLKQSRCVKR
jgi:hypothetical protein